MKIPTTAASMTSDFTLISLLGILLALPSAALPVSAQSPAAPPAAAAPASTEPSRASVEKVIPEPKSYLATREVSMTRLVNEITALDQSIQTAVQKVLALLTESKDSNQTRTNAAKLKQETIAGLRRAAEAYNQYVIPDPVQSPTHTAKGGGAASSACEGFGDLPHVLFLVAGS